MAKRKHLENLNYKEINELQNKEYDWLAEFLEKQEATEYRTKSILARTVSRILPMQLQIIEKATKNGFANTFAAYWYSKDFSDFKRKELRSICHFKDTMLQILIRMDKTPEEHHEFFRWMREKLDTIGLRSFYEEYGIVALAGYVKTLSGILSTFLASKLGESMAEVWEKEESASLASKEQLEWLLGQFNFLSDIKEHDLDPFELMTEKVVAEIPKFKNIIARGLSMTRLLIDDF